MAWGGPKIPMMPMTWFPGAFGKKRQTAPVAAEALDMPHGMLTGGAGTAGVFRASRGTGPVVESRVTFP